MIALQLGIFQLAPWVIALYPAILSVKSVISGLLSGRLSTALHLGMISPRFFGNSKSFYKIVESILVLTFVMSLAVSLFSIIFGQLFWGISVSDYLSIFSIMVATITLGLAIILLTIKVAFFSFKRGLDQDIVVYPVLSTVASILVTLCYIVVLNIFFYTSMGNLIIDIVVLANILLVLYFSIKNIHQAEFVKIIRDSLAVIFLVGFMVNITGTVLKGIGNFTQNLKEVYTVYPALINVVSDVGSIVGSTATTRIALGLITPSFSSIGKHAKNIFSAWASSFIMFILFGVVSLLINGVFSLQSLSSFILIMVVSNVISVFITIIISHSIAILRFKKGLDPDKIVIPIETSFAYLATTIALFLALLLFA